MELEKLQAYQRRMGRSLPRSRPRTDFNFDLGEVLGAASSAVAGEEVAPPAPSEEELYG